MLLLKYYFTTIYFEYGSIKKTDVNLRMGRVQSFTHGYNSDRNVSFSDPRDLENEKEIVVIPFGGPVSLLSLNRKEEN